MKIYAGKDLPEHLLVYVAENSTPDAVPEEVMEVIGAKLPGLIEETNCELAAGRIGAGNSLAVPGVQELKLSEGEWPEEYLLLPDLRAALEEKREKIMGFAVKESGLQIVWLSCA